MFYATERNTAKSSRYYLGLIYEYHRDEGHVFTLEGPDTSTWKGKLGVILQVLLNRPIFKEIILPDERGRELATYILEEPNIMWNVKEPVK